MATTPTAPAGTGAANGMMAGITTAHLVLIAVLAVLVVLAVAYGSRLRARRRKAEREERDRIATFQAAPPPPAPEPTPATAGIAAPPPPPGPPPTPPAGGDVPIPAADVFETTDEVGADAAARTDGDVASVEQRAPAAPDSSLTQLKGLGPKVGARLAELGITRLDQMAALDEDAAEAVDAQLGAFRGRLTRDRWVEQARFLAAGDRAGFEAVFGRL